MNYSLQVHEAKYVFPIPDGLKELSSDIIREVLRHQPNHINGFVADYLETMLTVREHARDAGIMICEAFREGYFLDELFKTKNITREQANMFATLIQAAWRGYVVRTKLTEWMKKKKKMEEERQRNKSLKIEELLAGLGITYDEAKRAAGVIQTAYQESKRGKWIPGESGEYWIDEVIPLGQRIKEGDRALGRFDKWDKEDFGDFFEMDRDGAIKYVWPRVGQLRKVLREEMPKDVPVVEFFAMRDLNGQEQYSYLIKSQSDTETRGSPIGFIVPMPKTYVMEYSQEVDFVDAINQEKMGNYSYIFRDDVEREELKKFEELLKVQAKANVHTEVAGELDYDPNWVLPRVIVRIKKDLLLTSDIEVKFASLPEGLVCERDNYTFRAETLQQTLKIIRHILRNECLTVEDGLVEAANMSPYKFQETGRIFPVDKFLYPSYIQKIEITPESATAEEESIDLMRYIYVFLPLDSSMGRKLPKGERTFSISIIRFQGFHSDYKGSSELENKIFIMGPKMMSPNGKPLTYDSVFWDEFGIEAWYQLLYNLENIQETEGEREEEGEGEEITEFTGETYDRKRTAALGESELTPRKSEIQRRPTEPKLQPEEPTTPVVKMQSMVADQPSEVYMEAEGENKTEKQKEKAEEKDPGEPENEAKATESKQDET